MVDKLFMREGNLSGFSLPPDRYHPVKNIAQSRSLNHDADIGDKIVGIKLTGPDSCAILSMEVARNIVPGSIFRDDSERGHYHFYA